MNRPIHFEILAENPAQTAEFYKQALGWEVASPTGPEAYWLLSTGPKSAPGIDGGMMRRAFPQAVINTIEVESLPEALARIERAGGKKVHGPNQIPGVGLHAYCADPEGTLFGILQASAG